MCFNISPLADIQANVIPTSVILFASSFLRFPHALCVYQIASSCVILCGRAFLKSSHSLGSILGFHNFLFLSLHS